MNSKILPSICFLLFLLAHFGNCTIEEGINADAEEGNKAKEEMGNSSGNETKELGGNSGGKLEENGMENEGSLDELDGKSAPKSASIPSFDDEREEEVGGGIENEERGELLGRRPAKNHPLDGENGRRSSSGSENEGQKGLEENDGTNLRGNDFDGDKRGKGTEEEEEMGDSRRRGGLDDSENDELDGRFGGELDQQERGIVKGDRGLDHTRGSGDEEGEKAFGREHIQGEEEDIPEGAVASNGGGLARIGDQVITGPKKYFREGGEVIEHHEGRGRSTASRRDRSRSPPHRHHGTGEEIGTSGEDLMTKLDKIKQFKGIAADAPDHHHKKDGSAGGVGNAPKKEHLYGNGSGTEAGSESESANHHKKHGPGAGENGHNLHGIGSGTDSGSDGESVADKKKKNRSRSPAGLGHHSEDDGGKNPILQKLEQDIMKLSEVVHMHKKGATEHGKNEAKFPTSPEEMIKVLEETLKEMKEKPLKQEHPNPADNKFKEWTELKNEIKKWLEGGKKIIEHHKHEHGEHSKGGKEKKPSSTDYYLEMPVWPRVMKKKKPMEINQIVNLFLKGYHVEKMPEIRIENKERIKKAEELKSNLAKLRGKGKPTKEEAKKIAEELKELEDIHKNALEGLLNGSKHSNSRSSRRRHRPKPSGNDKPKMAV